MNWRNEHKKWKPYNRPLTEDELPYLEKLVKPSQSWFSPVGEKQEEKRKTEMVEKEEP